MLESASARTKSRFFFGRSPTKIFKYFNGIILQCACSLVYYVNMCFEILFLLWHFYQNKCYLFSYALMHRTFGALRLAFSIFSEKLSLCTSQVYTQSTTQFICMFALCRIMPAAIEQQPRQQQQEQQQKSHQSCYYSFYLFIEQR